MSVQIVIRETRSEVRQPRNNQPLIWGVLVFMHALLYVFVIACMPPNAFTSNRNLFGSQGHSLWPSLPLLICLFLTPYPQSEIPPQARTFSQRCSLIHPHPVRPYHSSPHSALFHSDFLSSTNTELSKNSQVVQVHYFGR